MRTSPCWSVLLALFLSPSPLRAQEASAAGPAGARKVMPASDEAESAIKAFRPAPGFKVELFAAEPHVANISSFDIAPDGRFYVVEVFRRRGGGVLDMRTLPGWLDDDLASRTVADRVAMVKRRLPPQDVRAMEIESDRVRLVEDRDRDGRADHATVFADGFRNVEDGTAAGVLALRGGDVLFANVPSLWLLRDQNNDGTADARKALHTGFGVHFNISGHDLHGLRLGPDGRVYFSVGDRGFHVTTPEGDTISNPDSGAVLRCEIDGSNLELVHTGLRNPQDLAFDEHGNLFTCDNNSDGGDKSRWVHVVSGGDSGWRTGYQWHEFPASRGPWNNERLWDVKSDVPAAYVLPPLANPDIPGPSGLTYTPGTGLPPDWQNRFLCVDFRGGPANSGIVALRNKPKGATFELVETKKLVTGTLPTDLELGYDGALYFSDWVDGWVPMGKGRIYRLAHESARKDPTVAEAARLVSDGFAKTAVPELTQLLGHADVRVRVAAQLELAGRKEFQALADVATGDKRQLARLHALWGLRRMSEIPAGESAFWRALLKDPDPVVRAHAVALLGAFGPPTGPDILPLFEHSDDRVRFSAATAAGRGRVECIPEAIELLRRNDDRDAYVRHAAVQALVGRPDVNKMLRAANDPSPAVRLGITLALRRLKHPQVAKFLEDAEPAIVLEAARAINDTPIDEATGALAALASRPAAPGKGKVRDLILMRALNANFRLGTAASATVLAHCAQRPDLPDFLRVEALKMLGDWAKPATRDRVTGVYHPIPARDERIAFDAIRPVLPELLRTAPDAVRVAAAGLVAGVGMKDTTVLVDLVRNGKFSGEARAAALDALAQQSAPDLANAVDLALADRNPNLRRAAISAAATLPDGAARLRRLVDGADPRDQQAAFAAAASLGDAGDPLLLDSLDRLLAGKIAPEARLDLVSAAEDRSSSPPIAEKLRQYQERISKEDPLAAHRDALAGGSAERGRYIFHDRTDVQCLRCHSVKGAGGTAGPDLTGIGTRKPREYILESILFPPNQIAPGWETVVVRVKNGDTFAGVLKSEDADNVVLIDPEKGELRIPKSTITGRRGGQSAMPSDIAAPLTKHDLRDLVEFLASSK